MNKMIKELVLYAIEADICKEEDYFYMVNQLLSLFKIDDFVEVNSDEIDIQNPLKYISPLLDQAVKLNLIDDTISSRDTFEAKMMDIFMPRPSECSEHFGELTLSDPEASTKYLYDLSVRSNYIKTDRVSKNISWKSESKYGLMDMTINISKPEKSIQEIKEAAKVDSNYPKCPLCIQNVGFSGTKATPARNQLRAVPVDINNEEFFLQYSPYVYYNEHSICFKKTHDSMKINDDTFKRLLDFVELFPHYFLGSNADLPIVGGSILTHEHYQGGNYEFPIQRARATHTDKIDGCTLRRLYWPMTVIQLEGSKDAVAKLASKILRTWKTYNLEEANIISETTTEHNTVTPIARMKDGMFQMDIALRNNRTNDEFPDGIFHSHPMNHHIKRENLGLIEAMGMIILPARLVEELELVLSSLNGEDVDLGLHSEWASSLDKNVDMAYLQNEVSKKFVACLEDSGVFKNNLEGNIQFLEFLDEVRNNKL